LKSDNFLDVTSNPPVRIAVATQIAEICSGRPERSAVDTAAVYENANPAKPWLFIRDQGEGDFSSHRGNSDVSVAQAFPPRICEKWDRLSLSSEFLAAERKWAA